MKKLIRVKKSFRFKIIASYTALIALPFIFIALYLPGQLEHNSIEEVKANLIKQAALIESQIHVSMLQKADAVGIEALIIKAAKKIEARLTVIDKNGKVLTDSGVDQALIGKIENHADRPEVRTALSGIAADAIRYSKTLKINMLYVALPVKENNEVVAVMRIALPLETVKHMLAVTSRVILFSLLLALGLAFMVGSILARNIVRPINRIIYTVRKFALGEFGHRIYRMGNDEIGDLAATLNNMAHDIEEKIRQIKVQNQQLTNLFQSMVEGLIVTDKDARIITVNPSFERMFGVKKDEAVGRNFMEVIRNPDLINILARILENGIAVSQELSVVWPVQKTLKVNAVALFADNHVSGTLVVIHDITETKRLETIRTDFVANVSHELKTPLTAIKGFVETLQEGALEDKENARHFLQIIHEHTDRLNSLLNDLLDLSSLESKQAQLSKEKIGLKFLVDKVVSGFSVALAKHNIEVSNNIPQDMEIFADRSKLEQVLTNLIDNAIKFNKSSGRIIVSAVSIDSGMKVIVEDTGSGIPAKDIPRIFERFYRVDKARSRSLGGTGLGLSIVKHIIELHGGNVGVNSNEGVGSSFWFFIPAQA